MAQLFLPLFKGALCSCPRGCNCENPPPEGPYSDGVYHVSTSCPVHNDFPQAGSCCPVHEFNPF